MVSINTTVKCEYMFHIFLFSFQLNSPAVLPLLHLYFEVEVNNKNKGKEGEFSTKNAYPSPSTKNTKAIYIKLCP